MLNASFNGRLQTVLQKFTQGPASMIRKMCRIGALAATASLIALGAQAAPADGPSPASAKAPEAPAAVKADAAARAAAIRLTPLDRVTFWQSQLKIDARDPEANLGL